jgi:hypothetical protein
MVVWPPTEKMTEVGQFSGKVAPCSLRWALFLVLLWADRRARYYASPIILSDDAEADCDDARDDTEACSSAASDQR